MTNINTVKPERVLMHDEACLGTLPIRYLAGGSKKKLMQVIDSSTELDELEYFARGFSSKKILAALIV